MNELKPCPHCGGKAEIKDWTCGYESGTAVYCIQCGASVNDSVVNGDGWHDRAIIAWNHRAVPENKAITYSVEFSRDEITEFRHFLNAVKNNQMLNMDIRMSVFKLLHKFPDTACVRKPEKTQLRNERTDKSENP